MVYHANLSDGNEENQDTDLVEVLERSSLEQTNDDCSQNVLLRIPFYKLTDGTVVRIKLEYGEIAKGTTIHVGNSPTNSLNGGDRGTTLHNSEIHSNDTNFNFYMSSLSLCDQNAEPNEPIDLSKILLLNKSLSFINPRTKIAIYITDNWFRIDNLDRNTTLYYSNNYLFTFKKSILSNQCEKNYLSQFNHISPFLYIGLNRAIVDSSLQPGTGLCKAEISFLNCYSNEQPDLEVNVADLKYKLSDSENISWISPLSYLETSVMEHSPCSAQGVLRLKYDPGSMRRVARFDLDFGEMLSGFTFNIGDSPTNNAYGGDTGTTSNSAEIHSNDNRFYVWLNTKFCGDTLLYKIEYSLFQSNDRVTFFISDQRIEVNNYRGYHQIFKSPYLFNLNGQNVTCNCFDTRCYAGVKPDFDVYFGINRVIGGTYRPGVGLCGAKISWLKCGGKFKISPNLVYSDDLKLETSTALPKIYTKEIESSPAPSTETVIEKQEVITSTQEPTSKEKTTIPVSEQTTTVTEPVLDNLFTSTESLAKNEESKNLNAESENLNAESENLNAESENLNAESEIFTANTTSINILDLLKNSSVEVLNIFKNDYSEEETEEETEDEENVDLRTEDDLKSIEEDEISLFESSDKKIEKGGPLLIRKNITVTDPVPSQNASTEAINDYSKYCTEENMKKNFIYHEHKTESDKFIYCENLEKAIILNCPLKMKWSQQYLQCLQ
ncbi:signal CUB and EGF-like domain-containing 1 isoform X1, partial [Brachionus plicatilis]